MYYYIIYENYINTSDKNSADIGFLQFISIQLYLIFTKKEEKGTVHPFW